MEDSRTFCCTLEWTITISLERVFTIAALKVVNISQRSFTVSFIILASFISFLISVNTNEFQ